ncbi:MAG: DEAD/DEAH box helicase family protein, partial [Actinobacteria bacterium]|nr:DEAD/DEAH box helicase family protein [Actinomycetota bacterium]
MLKQLELKPVYESSDHDLIKDLIIPLLQNSKEYLRGVGFFTSGWLRVAAQGIVKLVENGGQARIVLSPNLQESDWEAFQLGERARIDEALKNILERDIGDLQSALEKNTLNCLAWMIADGVLEFRFAIPRVSWQGGDYHDKVGIFIDEEGSQVAIHGSFNDSIKGTLNGEAFSVFKSWEPGQFAYVERHHERLTRLWEGQNAQFGVFSIPEAVRERFIELRSTDNRPYSLPSTGYTYSGVGIADPQCPVKLHSYQEDAINKWIDADCRGIFEMATGTGKTYTSLAAAINRYEHLGRLALIVLVPYLHLLEQWEQNCREFGFTPILCSGEHTKWQLKVQSKIQDFNLKAFSNICILAVHQTAAMEKFRKAVKELLPETTMLIGDEAHGLGSSKLRDALLPQAGLRLGLSATP